MYIPRTGTAARIMLASLASAAGGFWVAYAVLTMGGHDTAPDVAMLLIALAMTLTLSLAIALAAIYVRDKHAEFMVRVVADVTRPAVHRMTGPFRRVG